MKRFYLSVFGGDKLPAASEVLAVFSWRVVTASNIYAAMAQYLVEVGNDYSWQWVLQMQGRRKATINAWPYSVAETMALIGRNQKAVLAENNLLEVE